MYIKQIKSELKIFSVCKQISKKKMKRKISKGHEQAI